MSSRKPGYIIGVVLVALLFSAPQLMMLLSIVAQGYQNGRFFVDYSNWRIPGLGGTVQYWNSLSNTAFWRDQFVSTVYTSSQNGQWSVKVVGISPETRKQSDLDVVLTGRGWYGPHVVNDRLWFVGNFDAYELVDDKPVPSKMTSVGGIWSQKFEWRGDPAFFERYGTDYLITSFTAGAWTKVATVVFPESNRIRSLGDISINFSHIQALDCRQYDDHLHLFANVNGHFLYRDGLEVKVGLPAPLRSMYAIGTGGDPNEEAVSALKPANTDADLDGWSVIWSYPDSKSMSPVPQQRPDWQTAGMFVDGQPAALVVDEILTGYPLGHVYRFDGKTWKEVASPQFPFGCNAFRTVSSQDGLRSYLVATTSTGVAHIYAVEATGIRETEDTQGEPNQALRMLSVYATFPLVMLVLGAMIGGFTWLLMWWFTKPEYGFGTRTVRLGSLARRGLARLIDLAIVILTTVGLGWVLTRGLDWLSLVEALNLHVDHPTVPIAARVACVLAGWLFAIIFSLIISQGLWGVTPGKWLCRLRTVRTTLRPCGTLASLARELVFLLDCCGFLCWTPGILSIAFNDQRQRLGDIVADTMVVGAHSMKECRARSSSLLKSNSQKFKSRRTHWN